MEVAAAMNSRRSWLMFGVAITAYLVAVLQRSSLGVAAVEATDRFGITAATLSLLGVVQIVVYAVLQIPVGVMVDRVGPRALLATGAALMLLGQLTLALAPTFTLALVARVLVGAGDAMTFIAAVRFLAHWFDGRTLPFVTQLLGTAGQLGQVLSALPLALIIHEWGWTPAYLSAAALSVIALIVVVTLGREPTPVDAVPARPTWRHSLHQLRDSLARPGTQLGFWAHFALGGSVTMFSLLWGFPFLSIGLGYGATGAAALLTLMILSSALSGPLLGILSARFPFRRSNIVLGLLALLAIAWGAVLGWPGHPPLWLIVILLVLIAMSGPASLIGFDFARTFNPQRAHGSASGVVNVGGFSSGFIIMFAVGVILDLLDRGRAGSGVPAELYSWESFRVAFLVQYVVIGAGVAAMLRARHRTRRQLHADEGIEVAPLWVSLVRAWRHRRG